MRWKWWHWADGISYRQVNQISPIMFPCRRDPFQKTFVAFGRNFLHLIQSHHQILHAWKLLFQRKVVHFCVRSLVDRYRKFNLLVEKAFNSPKEPDLCTFKTDFGVTFGMFICFDILFTEPSVRLVKEKHVTDIVYSAAWFSEMPLLTGKRGRTFTALPFSVSPQNSTSNRTFFEFFSRIDASSVGILDGRESAGCGLQLPPNDGWR